MKKTSKQLEFFLRSTGFDRGIRLGIAITVPFFLLYALGYVDYAPAVALGIFLNAQSDVPGSYKRKVITILISIALTMTITAIILFCRPFLPLLLIALTVTTFIVSLLAVYGFRASLVSFSGLLAMVIAFAIQKETPFDIMVQVLLMGVGGFWYLLISYIFHKLAPVKEENELLAGTLLLIGNYLKLRAKLLTKKTKRNEYIKEALVLQNQINEKHETLRESLLKTRKRSGRSRYEEKQLLILLASINIFELIEAKHLDYQMIDNTFGNRKEFLRASQKLNKIMGNHLIRLSELLIQNKPIPNKEKLLKGLSAAFASITAYIETVKLPEAREGALILKNLYDYQEQLVEEIRIIRRVMANVYQDSKVTLKPEESEKFLTTQEYSLDLLIQNFSLNSTMFRHACRLTIAVVFAYLMGYFLAIQNTYWILLTIIVIMRPSYGLTKVRSKDRVIGTLVGAAFAVSVVFVTQNTVLYGLLAMMSLVYAFIYVQQNYKWSAVFITISVIFVYSIINPNAYEVIQYRILDTVLGAGIAVVANYAVLPRWEADNIKRVLINAIDRNKKYIHATLALYQNTAKQTINYKVARKEAFLAISNLNAAFQRFTQDPKSKQKEFQLIYELVTINQTMVSAIAAIGNFISTHKTTKVSDEFLTLVDKISNTLQSSLDILNDHQNEPMIVKDRAQQAQEVLLKKYQQLASLKDDFIYKTNPIANTTAMHELQEAYLIANHMTWLASLSENLKRVTKRYHEAIALNK